MKISKDGAILLSLLKNRRELTFCLQKLKNVKMAILLIQDTLIEPSKNAMRRFFVVLIKRRGWAGIFSGY